MTLKKIAGGILMVVVALLAGWLPARADWTWEQTELTTLELGATVKTLSQGSATYTVKSNLVRLDDVARGGCQIINFENRQFLLINFQTKAFILFPLDEMIKSNLDDRAAIKGDLDNKAAEAAGLPGEQGRLMAAQVQAQRKKYQLWERPYTVRKTAETATVANHPCSKFEGLSGEEVFQELWVAEDLPLPPEFQGFFSVGMVQLDPQQYSHFLKLPGFPMKVINHYGPVTVTIEVVKVSNAVVTVDAFLIPPDFRESDNKVSPGN